MLGSGQTYIGTELVEHMHLNLDYFGQVIQESSNITRHLAVVAAVYYTAVYPSGLSGTIDRSQS